MPCGTCKCNFCARNCELPTQFVTIGEVEEVCFTCDDCKHWGGDYSKRSMWRPDCPNYLEPKKFADYCANMRRSKLRLLPKSSSSQGIPYHIPKNPQKTP